MDMLTKADNDTRARIRALARLVKTEPTFIILKADGFTITGHGPRGVSGMILADDEEVLQFALSIPAIYTRAIQRSETSYA